MAFWKESGCATELDYTEQTSRILFRKYLDDLKHESALAADLAGKPYAFIIDKPHRWSSWVAPKKADNGTVRAVRACGPFGGSVAKGMKEIRYSGYLSLVRCECPAIDHSAGWREKR